ncbi:MAG: amidohydrolase family protein [Verrucomicrobiota bacterium]|nr:amidohydrolase family protein [Verrucomicrobiota bacterium]
MFSAYNYPSKISSVDFYRGPVLRSLSDNYSEYFEDALIVTQKSGEKAGLIVAIGEAAKVANELKLDLSSLKKNKDLLMPAFFDTHFHWVQDDVRQMPKVSLIEWLERYTFPEEAKYSDRIFSSAKAKQFWKRILSVGTIGGLCYSSVHEVALEEAFKHAPEDFYIGNVLMTMNCPEDIRQSPHAACASVENCANRYKSRYVCSPRFAPTTCPEAMQASALAAAQHNCFQQTHLGETKSETMWVLDIYSKIKGFEDVKTYTEIYERVKMLGPKTIFGHCIYLADNEWKLLADSGSRIASCPSSNAPIEQLGIGSGLFDFEKAELMGVPWALASDIGGGPFLSMFDVMRSFVLQNRKAGRNTATFTKALHRTTFKAAELMNLSADRGMLEVAKYLDAIRVPMPPGLQAGANGEAALEALIHLLPNRESSDTFVNETIIKGKSHFRKEAVV